MRKGSGTACAYLILQWRPGQDDLGPSAAAKRGAKKGWKADLRVVCLLGSPFGRRVAGPVREDDYRWAFTFQRAREDDKRAGLLADALEGFFCLLHGPMGSDPISVHRFPLERIRSNGTVRIEHIIERPGPFMGLAFSTTMRIPAETSRAIWQLLPSARDPRILAALTFYRASVDRVWFSPGDLYDINRWEEEGDVPPSAVDHAAHDSAFQDAYKAIEAIVGDPNKRDAKFHEQLRAAGIDPATPVGFRTKEPLATRIRILSIIRDKRTGHGTRPRKAPLTKGELIEVQECARYVIWKSAHAIITPRQRERLSQYVK